MNVFKSETHWNHQNTCTIVRDQESLPSLLVWHPTNHQVYQFGLLNIPRTHQILLSMTANLLTQTLLIIFAAYMSFYPHSSPSCPPQVVIYLQLDCLFSILKSDPITSLSLLKTCHFYCFIIKTSINMFYTMQLKFTSHSSYYSVIPALLSELQLPLIFVYDFLSVYNFSPLQS